MLNCGRTHGARLDTGGHAGNALLRSRGKGGDLYGRARRLITVISLFEPMRRGGPQVPVPGET